MLLKVIVELEPEAVAVAIDSYDEALADAQLALAMIPMIGIRLDHLPL